MGFFFLGDRMLRLSDYKLLAETLLLGEAFGNAKNKKNAHTQAKEKGLVYLGFGNYVEPSDAVKNPSNPSIFILKPGKSATWKKDEETDTLVSIDSKDQTANDPDGVAGPTAGSEPANKIGVNKPPSKEKKRPSVPTSQADRVLQTTEAGKIKDEAQKQALRNADAGKALLAQNLTHRQAQNLSKEDRAGQGAGNPASKAGEAVVVNTLRQIIMEMKSKTSTMDGRDAHEYAKLRAEAIIDSLRNEVAENKKNRVLTESWIDSSEVILNQVIDILGKDLANIDEIVWDTPYGRHLIDADKHDTPSDMFIKLKNGKLIGVSLKKDGNVRAGGIGLKELTDNISAELRSKNVPQDEIDKLVYEIGGTRGSKYDQEMRQRLGLAQQVATDRHGMIDAMQWYADGVMSGKIKDATKILPYLQSTNGDINYLFTKDTDKFTGSDIKLFTRLFQNMQGGEFSDTATDMIRSFTSVKNGLTKRILQQLRERKELGAYVKQRIFNELYFDDVLGIRDYDEDSPQKIDIFMVLYGDKNVPTARLDYRSLSNFFNEDAPEFAQWVYDAQRGDEIAKNKVRNLMMDRIVVDFGASDKEGVIKLTRKNPSPPPDILSQTLFTIVPRVKSSGSPPMLEIRQQPAMIYSLAKGLDVNEWDANVRRAHYKNEYQFSLSQLRDQVQGSPTYTGIVNELQRLRQNIDLDDEQFNVWKKKTQRDIETQAQEDTDD